MKVIPPKYQSSSTNTAAESSSLEPARRGGFPLATLHCFSQKIFDWFYIQYNLPTDTRVRIAVLDSAGGVWKVLLDTAGLAGSHLLVMESSLLLKGTYLLELRTSGGVVILPFSA